VILRARASNSTVYIHPQITAKFCKKIHPQRMEDYMRAKSFGHVLSTQVEKGHTPGDYSCRKIVRFVPCAPFPWTWHGAAPEIEMRVHFAFFLSGLTYHLCTGTPSTLSVDILCVHTLVLSNTHTITLSHTHTRGRTHAGEHTRAHTHTHACTHECTCTHTYLHKHAPRSIS